MKKLTQKKTAFYLLWVAHKENPEQFLPAWKFVGEVHIKEIDAWFFMSYKGPTNGLSIYQENEGLVERRMTIGKTGARYFEYRIADLGAIKEPELKAFYELITQETVVI